MIARQSLQALALLLVASFVRLGRRRRLWYTPDPRAPEQLLNQCLHLRKVDRRKLRRSKNKYKIPAGRNLLVDQPYRLAHPPSRTITIDGLTDPLADNEPATRHAAPACCKVERQKRCTQATAAAPHALELIGPA